MNLNSAFSACIHRAVKRGIGDRRGKQRNEVLIVCHGCGVFYIPVQCFVLHVQADRHNRGEYAYFTGDSRCAVLNYAAYYVFSIGELHSVTDTVYHSEDSGIRHEIVDVSAMQEGMSKSQHPVVIYSGDCSCCGHREVSVNDSSTYSFSRLKLCSVKCRRVACGEASIGFCLISHRRQLFSEHGKSLCSKAACHEGAFKFRFLSCGGVFFLRICFAAVGLPFCFTACVSLGISLFFLWLFCLVLI